MNKFLVLFLAPASVMQGWMQKPAEERKEMEDQMKSEWQTWMQEHKGSFVEMPAGAGKTKRVSSDGVSDVSNDVMMFCVVEAESPEAAADIFKGHTHLQIPQATIDVMQVNAIPMS
jgi:hypothetical protein